LYSSPTGRRQTALGQLPQGAIGMSEETPASRRDTPKHSATFSDLSGLC